MANNRSCFSLPSCFGGRRNNSDSDNNETFKNVENNLIIGLDGIMKVPSYSLVARAECPLLLKCWARDWPAVVERCKSHPEEAFYKTQHSGRTALHLSTFSNEGCPKYVAQAILKANRHAMLVPDQYCYTPLHNVCLFSSSSSTNTENISSNNNELISLFCDIAILVEQQLQGYGSIPTASGTSPLYLAAKRSAPVSTLKALLSTRTRTKWIAPSTGGEVYWDSETLDEYSSPLEILLRNRMDMINSIDTLKNKENVKNKMRDLVFKMRKIKSNTKTITSTTTNTTNNNEQKSKSGSSTTNTDKYTMDNRHGDDNDNNNNNDDDIDEKGRAVLELWEKCLVLLEEHCPMINVSSGENDSTSSDDHEQQPQQHQRQVVGLVHAIARLKVPIPALLQLSLELFPEHFLYYDEYNRTPIYHIISAHHPYATKQLLKILLSSYHSQSFLLSKLRLQSQPQQSKRRKSNYHDITGLDNNTTTTTTFTTETAATVGNTINNDIIQEAFILALNKGMPWDDILKEIIVVPGGNANEMLCQVDKKTNLFPFQLAASCNASLDTIFCLLSACPQLVVANF